MTAAKVLIVDDNPSNMKLLSFVLTMAGYDVRSAADAPDALGVLKEFPADVILMDLQLPGMDGLELTRRLRADSAHCQVAILAVTASAMLGDEQRAMQAGCDGYVTKPIDTRALPEFVASYLRERRGSSSAGA